MGWGLLVYKPWYHYQEGVTKIKLPGTGIRDQIENPMNNHGPRRRPSEQSEIRERADPYTPHCPGSYVAPRHTLTSFSDLLPCDPLIECQGGQNQLLPLLIMWTF